MGIGADSSERDHLVERRDLAAEARSDDERAKPSQVAEHLTRPTGLAERVSDDLLGSTRVMIDTGGAEPDVARARALRSPLRDAPRQSSRESPRRSTLPPSTCARRSIGAEGPR